jgi:hypothetical protein
MAEIRRLTDVLIINPIRDISHPLHWSDLRRHHQGSLAVRWALILQLTRNGTPATQLVGLHARLDQLESSVARTTALLSGGHGSHGCRSICRG